MGITDSIRVFVRARIIVRFVYGVSISGHNAWVPELLVIQVCDQGYVIRMSRLFVLVLS